MKKQIDGYEGYFVSDKGEIYSTKYGREIELKQSLHKGYRRVALSKQNKRKIFHVHCLVAKAFIPNPENKPFVNHKDGNRRNNNVLNLEWCTREENQRHSREVLGNTGLGAKNSHYGYRSAKLYPNEELRSRLVELGIPRYCHNLAELGEMLPAQTRCLRSVDGEWYCDFNNSSLSRANTEADARGLCLIYLIENGLLDAKNIK